MTGNVQTVTGKSEQKVAETVPINETATNTSLTNDSSVILLTMKLNLRVLHGQSCRLLFVLYFIIFKIKP